MKAAAAAVAVAALILAAPAQATRIVGTARGDLLHGTARADTVLGRAGNDRIDVAGGGRDTVACGPGRDLVTADQTDRLGRDCETVVRRISVDVSSGGGAAHATEVEPDSFAWGSTVVADFQVGRFRDGGALAIGFATSSDAGRTWRSGLLPGLTISSRPKGAWLRASDPVVTFDAAHRTWLASSFGLGMTDSGMVVSRSSDGIHWSPPVVATQGQNNSSGELYDKDWISCDNGASSPFFGHCYLSYSDFVAGRLSTQTSTDGGLTWGVAGGVTRLRRSGRHECRGAGSAADDDTRGHARDPDLRGQPHVRRIVGRRRRHLLAGDDDRAGRRARGAVPGGPAAERGLGQPGQSLPGLVGREPHAVHALDRRCRLVAARAGAARARPPVRAGPRRPLGRRRPRADVVRVVRLGADAARRPRPLGRRRNDLDPAACF